MRIVFILVGIVIGILSFTYLIPLPIIAFSVILLFGLRFIISFVVKRSPFAINTLRILNYCWIVNIGLLLGLLSSTLNAPKYGTSYLTISNYSTDTEYIIKGYIKSRISKTTVDQFEVEVKSIQSAYSGLTECHNTKILLNVPVEISLNSGEKVIFRTKLQELSSSRSSRWNIEYSAFISNPGNIKIIGKFRSPFILLGDIRDSLTYAIDRSGLSEDTRTLMKALILADRSGLKRKNITLFREAGIAHILAVSGMHAGIICGALMFITLPLILIGGRKSRYIVVIIAMWLFTFLTGMNYSTVRAALMITLTSVAWIYERKRDPLSLVMLSAVIILIFSPRALWDIGFQLSFTCVASLAVFVTPFNPIRKREHPTIHGIYEAVLVTLIATASVAPLTIYYFGSHPTMFLFSNLVLIPVLPAYMGIGILYLIIILFGYEPEIIRVVLDFLTECFVKFTLLFEGHSIKLNLGFPGLIICMLVIISAAIIIRSRDTTGTNRPDIPNYP